MCATANWWKLPPPARYGIDPMNAAIVKNKASAARMPMQTMYPLSASHASRSRPVAAQTDSGMIETIAARAAIKRRA